MSRASEALAEFHAAFEVERDLPRHEQAERRSRLIAEEGRELQAALSRAAYRSRGPGIVEGIARELADVIYVAYGTADLLGIDLDAAFEAVHEANMAKLPTCWRCKGGKLIASETVCPECIGTGKGKPVQRESDGKVLRPPGWVKPDMSGAIK